ncbi:MAG: XamI family restriction endonuclease, partial [Rhodospirillaceae bacterium]|nr:XamI family restriction endonuclease [Rhodospirillaceae bacterium]
SEQYSRLFQNYVPVFRSIIDALPRLAVTPPDLDLLLGLLGGHKTRTAFRYLAAAPISEDDLKTLAETTLAPSVLRRHPERALRVRDTVLGVLDRHRFPWIAGRRLPSAEEVERAALASAALLAARRVETLRRSDARAIQEARVKDLLRNQGLSEVPKRDVPLIDAAPAAGEFCAESKLGDTRADILVRLYDRRLMPIECKVWNSAVNSFKRVNHEAAGKARKWLSAFGTRQIMPAAVLSGVFNPPIWRRPRCPDSSCSGASGPRISPHSSPPRRPGSDAWAGRPALSFRWGRPAPDGGAGRPPADGFRPRPLISPRRARQALLAIGAASPDSPSIMNAPPYRRVTAVLGPTNTGKTHLAI